jgi:hypothetical protein
MLEDVELVIHDFARQRPFLDALPIRHPHVKEESSPGLAVGKRDGVADESGASTSVYPTPSLNPRMSADIGIIPARAARTVKY